MVAKAAWLATKRNATPRVLQALAGYTTAVRRIGQGTGPNATLPSEGSLSEVHSSVRLDTMYGLRQMAAHGGLAYRRTRGPEQ
jgi:hypothetical protein